MYNYKHTMYCMVFHNTFILYCVLRLARYLLYYINSAYINLLCIIMHNIHIQGGHTAYYTFKVDQFCYLKSSSWTLYNFILNADVYYMVQCVLYGPMCITCVLIHHTSILCILYNVYNNPILHSSHHMMQSRLQLAPTFLR